MQLNNKSVKRQAAIALLPNVLGGMSGTNGKLFTAHHGTMTQNSLSETDQQELERLRTENRRLKTERDIVKKATAFFAKDSL